MKHSPIIRLVNETSQSQQLCKLIGNIPLISFVDLLFVADLDANVREASKSRVTDSIEESLENQPELFHYKTKGILAAASQVDVLERGRFRIHFKNPKLEGIIDGGHNSLAIGRFILNTILSAFYGEDEAEKILKSVKRWSDLKEALLEYESLIKENKGCLPDALVPFEVIYPANDHPDSLTYFEDQILIINAARNNNAQQKEEAKANQRGLYEELKINIDPKIADKVEWRTGEGGRIKARDLVALSLIPLSKLDFESTKTIQDNPVVIFSSKTQCVEIYNKILGNENDGIVEKVEGHIVQVVDHRVKSALKLMRDIPELYDMIYDLFPKLYSHGFGKISSVKTVSESDNDNKTQGKLANKIYLSKSPKTKFYQNETTHSYGEGFIYPIVVSLRELMKLDNQGNVDWVTDPKHFIKNNGKQIMEGYKDMIAGQSYDPGKVGKTKGSYNIVARAFRQILDSIELEELKAKLAAQR